MPVVVYRSTDAGAPTLNGTAGSLINVLKACLVDGYGSKQSAGWTMPYSAGSPITKAVFKQGAWGGTPARPQYHLRVLDDGSLAALGREAAVRAFETMSDVDTGTNPFPSPAQMANGLAIRKSHTADATAVPWILLADHRTFILVNYKTGFATGAAYAGYYFGDYIPADPNYPYCCGLMAKEDFNTTTFEVAPYVDDFTSEASSKSQIWIARDHTGGIVSVAAKKIASRMTSDISGFRTVGQNDRPEFNFFSTVGVNALDGRVWVARFLIRLPVSIGRVIMGVMRGVWAPTAVWSAYSDGATFTGSGEASGRTLEYRAPFKGRDQSGYPDTNGGIFLEISDTWGA